jgi:hypothetical protein
MFLIKEVLKMADKIRREKDLITRTIDRYKDTTLKDYARYFEGSPTYVTYYQLDMDATKQDTNLENVHSLVGASTPNKYKKIEDVVIYGVDAMQISNEIGDKGLQSLITGDFVLLPDSIRPYPGDFFKFDDTDLTEHLFRVNDVQYDKASPRKFFRCQYSLWQDNTGILGEMNEDGTYKNVSDEYVLDYKSIGGETSAVIKKADAAMADRIKLLVDGLIEKYQVLFYEEDMDNFLLPVPTSAGMVYYWLPYLQRFVHDHKVLDKYKGDFMSEIYVNNMASYIIPNIFDDVAYYNSIFRKVEIQEPLVFDNSFVSIDDITEIKKTKTLPFSFGLADYKLVQLNKDNLAKINSVHLLYQNVDQRLSMLDSKFKIANPTGGEMDIDPENYDDGDIIYELNSLSLPAAIYRKIANNLSSISFGDGQIIAGETIYNLIVRYINKTLDVTDELLIEINNLFLVPSLKNYILVPIMIYILKKKIFEAL